MPNKISFRRLDYSFASYLETYVFEFADHFTVKRKYLPEFCHMIRHSKRWNINNLEASLKKWSSLFGKTQGRKTIIELVDRAFKACKNNDDIRHLRGAIVEALAIALHGGSNTLGSKSNGWGAEVKIGQNRVKYLCTGFKTNECGDRSTVDFGTWNGHHGKFYECKANPILISCKELQYMRELISKLTQSNISYEIYFLCAESNEAVKQRLEKLDCKDQIMFKPIGYDNFYQFMAS